MGDSNLISRIKNSIMFDLTHIDKDIIYIYYEYASNKIKSLIYNQPDLSSEIFFWKRGYRQHFIETGQAPHPRGKKTKESICFSIRHLKKAFPGTLYCLDVGCGPTSQFYTDELKAYNGIKVVSVDPLAEVYQYLHNRYDSNYDIECIFGYGEKLTELFPEDYFHLIYSQNALDHSQDPEEFIKASYDVLKPGGLLVLHGFIKEGTAAHWLGLHNWDIVVKGDDLLLSNKKGTVFEENITGKLSMNVVYKWCTGENIGDMYTIIYKKLHEASEVSSILDEKAESVSIQNEGNAPISRARLNST